MPGRARPKLGLTDLADDYLAASRTTNAPATVERKRGILEHLIAELGDLPLEEIGPADVERYRWRRRSPVGLALDLSSSHYSRSCFSSPNSRTR